MALIDFKIYSETLRMQTSVTVVIPQRSTNGEIGIESKTGLDKFKCLYLLHGLSDDNTIWERRTNIERYASEYGIAVVMPSAERSFYSNMAFGLNYYDYIAKELPLIIEDTFNVSSRREDKFIGGNSMGGYGAIKIALTESGKFGGCFGLSSVANIHNPRFSSALMPVFNGNIPDYADLFKLASMKNNDNVKPRVFMSVGKDDFMYNDNVELSKHFKALNYDYTYIETEGGHNWGVWDETVRLALKWFLGEK